MPLFVDREDAGTKLAAVVAELATAYQRQDGSRPNTIAIPSDATWDVASKVSTSFRVYGLPKGGLPVAVAVAQTLGCPLDVIVAKKITHPSNPEFALGAVTAEGQILWSASCPEEQQRSEWVDAALQKAQAQLVQFRAEHPYQSPQGKLAILVDDGVATGMTMAVAIAALQDQQATSVWVAVPVVPPDVLYWLKNFSDRVVVLATPTPFHSVSRFYRSFSQVTMAEALACLRAANPA